MNVRGSAKTSRSADHDTGRQVTGPSAWTTAGSRLGSQQGFGRVMASLLTDPTLHGESFAAHYAVVQVLVATFIVTAHNHAAFGVLAASR